MKIKECNACLYLADDQGDNTCTIRCQLSNGHFGLHKEEFKRRERLVVITWEIDERVEDD